MNQWVLTANRLRDGRVVFLGPRGWEETIRTALIAATDAEKRALEAMGAQSVAACEVVDPYLVEVEIADGVPVPIHYRERIRALGPTVRPDLARTGELPENRRVPL